MRRDRFRGALLGLAVGDAVGTTVEFKPPGTFEPVRDMVGGGPFDLPAGAWTDDTSMALCLAESLVETRTFDPVDQLQRYVRWYREGHNSSTGTCFDIGNATRAALHRFEQTSEPFPGDAAPGRRRQRPADEARAGRPRVRLQARRRDPLRRRERAHDPRRAGGRRRVAGVRGAAPGALEGPTPPEGAGDALGTPRSRPRSPRPASRRPSAAAATSSTRSRPRCGRCAPPRRSSRACSPRSTSATTRTRPPRSTGSSRARSTASTASPRTGASAFTATTRSSRSPTRSTTSTSPAPRSRASSTSSRADRRVRDSAGRRRRPRSSGGPFAIRSGGHDFAGRSSTTGTLIDTRPLQRDRGPRRRHGHGRRRRAAR